MSASTHRASLSRAESIAVKTTAGAMAGFAVFGLATGAPSTLAYLLSVAAVGAIIGHCRRDPIPDGLAIALAVAAIVHLAGGLIRVGDDVLYNASIGPRIASLNTHLLQYDHFVHAFGAFLATLTLWVLLAPPTASAIDRRNVMVLCVLGGLGIGATNEVIEFIATKAHSAAHIGGYDNTGWDLVSNTIGALAALPLMRRIPRGSTQSTGVSG